MSKLLVLYGTTDGQTAKIARFLATELRTFGVPTDVVEAGIVRRRHCIGSVCLRHRDDRDLLSMPATSHCLRDTPAHLGDPIGEV